MTDINYTLRSEVRRKSVMTIGSGEAGNVKTVASSRAIPSGTAVDDTVKLLTLPSNARIHRGAQVAWDALAAATTTVSIGVGSVDGNITSDPDAILSGLDATSAGVSNLVTDHANYGKELWEIAGLSEDPRGELDIYATIAGAATDSEGDLTLEAVYTLD